MWQLALVVALKGGRPLHAQLSPGNEVPPTASNGLGSALVTLNPGQGEVCWDIEVGDLTTPVILAHIHQGGAGVNGPVVVDFMEPLNGLSGCVHADAARLSRVFRQEPPTQKGTTTMASKKKVAAVRLVASDDVEIVSGIPGRVRLSLDGIANVAREGLLAVASAAGLAVMSAMMDAEMTERVGAAKHAKAKDRDGNWHGTAAGSVVLGGRRVPVERPRGRTLAGDEIELDTYATFSDDDALSQLVLERMLAGVSTRRHVQIFGVVT